LFMILFIIHAAQAFSQDDFPSTFEIDPEIDAEFRWIKEEAVVMTEIATKTSIDADFAPGMITVLKGEDLEKRGFRTVYEALDMVPGMIRSNQVVVRGIGDVYESGKIKLLLNGVPMNNTLWGQPYALYSIPVEQVKQIEIIRGPGSALYGKWAYSGTLNVKTRNSGGRVFARYGSFDTYGFGGLVSHTDPEKDLKISLNAANWQRDRTGIECGQDSLYGTLNEDVSYAPGPVNDSRDSSMGILSLKYKDMYVMAQRMTEKRGSEYGVTGVLAPLDDRMPELEKTYSLEAGWQSELSDSIKLSLRAGWRKYMWDLEDMIIFPDGYKLEIGGEIVKIFHPDVLAGPHYAERCIYSGAELHWKAGDHQVLLGMEYEDIEMTESWSDANNSPITGEGLTSLERFSGQWSWIDPGNKREISGVFIQGQFSVTDRLDITAGLRYDSYDDTGNRFSPRIAGVFRASEYHAFKVQYAEAFRPPSFIEMYSMNNPSVVGNPDLDPEVIKTLEFGYIFRKSPFISRITLFYSKLEDLIAEGVYEGDRVLYLNSGSNAESTGAEAELKWNISRSFTIDTNLSYADSKDSDTDYQIQGSAKWLANIGVIYEPAEDMTVALQYRYVDKRARSHDDSRPETDASHTVNITATAENLFRKGITLRAGVKNLFDEDIRTPAAAWAFPEDLPWPGREWWVTVSYDF
ncbi:TonB-dependent receptor, partial [Desulfococcaceae bacterium HSG8]|nr:TonB-dependent receptor [Desulfococcaceae bacterium HSG8]